MVAGKPTNPQFGFLEQERKHQKSSHATLNQLQGLAHSEAWMRIFQKHHRMAKSSFGRVSQKNKTCKIKIYNCISLVGIGFYERRAWEQTSDCRGVKLSPWNKGRCCFLDTWDKIFKSALAFENFTLSYYCNKHSVLCNNSKRSLSSITVQGTSVKVKKTVLSSKILPLPKSCYTI